MDAKNIFISCNHYAGRIKWVLTKGNEWNYIGVGDDYNESKVDELIEQHFSNSAASTWKVTNQIPLKKKS